MIVELQYFKESGKFYGNGEFSAFYTHMHEYIAETRRRWSDRTLPGLVPGHTRFNVLITVPDLSTGYPHLIPGIF